MIQAEQIFEPSPQLAGLVPDVVALEFGSISDVDDS